MTLDCYHCGVPCPKQPATEDGHVFCCTGCLAVYEILQASGLQRYYTLEARPGTSQRGTVARPGRFAYLDDEGLQAELLDFCDGTTASLTLRMPQIHCAACVWLLENLSRLEPGVRHSEVDFLRRELALTYDVRALSLRQLVERLAAIGYEPEITLGSAARAPRAAGDPLVRRLGVAGFCFGNAMLFSLPEYFANPGDLVGGWQHLFAALNLALALPVLLYSATDYLAGAWRSLVQRAVTIDVPIAIGIVTLFSRSLYEIFSGAGSGYMDSFTGFVFFLLIGKLFQRHSFAALSFERDYRSYFPLAATVREGEAERSVAVTSLQPGQRLVARHGELVPADSRLLSAHGRLDLSYVTGESEPVEAERGDTVWAGGRVAAGALELEVLREASQSYLTRLWNRDLERQEEGADLALLINRVSRWFTAAVLAVAAATAAYWLRVDPTMAAHAATSVLIIACPCALALSTPFTTGAALNLLARGGLYLREGPVVERLARVAAIVFDKTGTLTSTRDNEVVFSGPALETGDGARLAALLANSVHPLSRKIHGQLPRPTAAASDYEEAPGLGLRAVVDGTAVCVGSREWLLRQGVSLTSLPEAPAGTAVYVAIAGAYRGFFHLGNVYRPGVDSMLMALRARWPLHLLSGDNDRERERLRPLFGTTAGLHFSQSPEQKLRRVRHLETTQPVLMVGDGLNDAGALMHSSVGLAVTEDVTAFSPACDGILHADSLTRLPGFLHFARLCMLVVASSIGLSLVYNIVGLSFAVRGWLSPMLSAVLMPLSSVSVIAFTAVATRLAARHAGITR